jgi:hypothetical protein
MAVPVLIEEQRTALYRQRLAALLRRPSRQWICFAVGIAPVHRRFFNDTAVAIEGPQAGGIRQRNGVSHRQVQYDVRLRIGACEPGRAAYNGERAVLAVADERDLETLKGQAALVGACVHVGLDMVGRCLQPLDNECAARIAACLYQLFESSAEADGKADIREELAAEASGRGVDAAFHAVAQDVHSHRRATCLTGLRATHPLEPGSFMKIIHADERAHLHRLLMPTTAHANRRSRQPRALVVARRSRFLALQAMGLAEASAVPTRAARTSVPVAPISA